MEVNLKLESGQRAVFETGKRDLTRPGVDANQRPDWWVRVFDENDRDLGIKATVKPDQTLKVTTAKNNIIEIPDRLGLNTDDAIPRITVEPGNPAPVVVGGSFILAGGEVRVPANTNDLNEANAPKVNDGKDNRFAAGSLSFRHVDPGRSDGTSRIITIEKKENTKIILLDPQNRDKPMLTLSALQGQESIQSYNDKILKKGPVPSKINAPLPAETDNNGIKPLSDAERKLVKNALENVGGELEKIRLTAYKNRIELASLIKMNKEILTSKGLDVGKLAEFHNKIETEIKNVKANSVPLQGQLETIQKLLNDNPTLKKVSLNHQVPDSAIADAKDAAKAMMNLVNLDIKDYGNGRTGGDKVALDTGAAQKSGDLGRFT